MAALSRDLPVFPLSPDPIRDGVAAEVGPAQHLFETMGPSEGTTVGLVTLGCDKNTVDSERILASLLSRNVRVTPEPAEADVVVVNTCGFIQAAKEQSIETLLEACGLKAEGGVRAVVAVGCMVQRYKEELQAEIPEIDLFLGLTELDSLIPELEARGLLEATQPVSTMERPLRVLTTSTPHTSYLKISEGCDHTCAFCAIPLMRGLHRSAPVEALVAEARSLEQAGVREINIISQDTTWFGRDRRRREGPDAALLPELLQALLNGTDIPWFRLFYMYPSGITRELVEMLAREPRLLPYLDLPIQHGSDRILTAMRRPERRQTILERVAWLRESVPDITLRTTVIVGFPGEEDDDFQALLDLLEEVRFDRVGAFTYSTEEGTRAADMGGQVSESLKRERHETLLDLQRSVSLERNLERIGTTARALVDHPSLDDPDYDWVARTESQALDVDGITYLTGDLTNVRPGAILDVVIQDAMEHDLVATVQSSS